MSATVLLATLLHALEAVVGAAAHWSLGAPPGLTTAFLFAMIQQLWPLGSRQRRSKS
jgi:hypothetical protein